MLRRLSTLLVALIVGLPAVVADDARAFAFLCNGLNANDVICASVNDCPVPDPSRTRCDGICLTRCSADRECPNSFCQSDGTCARGDRCGACSATSAARWDELQVDFRFDDNVRPAGGAAGNESLAEWQQHQTQTIANWNNVQGHSLLLRDAGAARFRVFGEVNGENSIFWITNRNEYFQQVGSGVDSTLGVTLAPYNCGSPRRDGILDADLVMNGTGSFNWDSNSVVSTMTHEVGHAIGLGHPCINCSESAERIGGVLVGPAIMSATGGGPGESDVPLFDDEESIRALYPGTPGGLGTACTSDGACDSGLCLTVPIGGVNRSFCSETCTTTCTNGMVCANVAGEGNVCVFSSAQLAQTGDRCGPPACVDECTGVDIGVGCNVCLDGDGDNTSECLAGCAPATGNQGCGTDETCIGFGCSSNTDCGGGTCSGGQCQNVGVCLSGGGTALRGQVCSANVGCVTGLTCVTENGANSGICLGVCAGDGSGCLQNENCLFLFGNSNDGACFAAGRGGEGDACGDFDECARGLICASGTCMQRCDRGFACALDDQTCTSLGAGGMSGCTPVGGNEGEGEGEGDPGEGEGEGGDCNADRGNFDCPQGRSCVNGTCVAGEGPVGTFGLCDTDDDCSGGLCNNGVCTRPCDVADGCPSGYTCDEAIPGGLCRAESCRDDEDICAADFRCTYSSASRYVCAKGVSGCACDATTANGSTPGLLAVAIVGLLRRRRRGQPGRVV